MLWTQRHLFYFSHISTQDKQEKRVLHICEHWVRYAWIIGFGYESISALVGTAQQYLGADRFPCTIVVLDGMMWSIVWKIACTAAEGDVLSWRMLLQKIENGIQHCWQCTEWFIQRCVPCVRETYLTDIGILQLKMSRMKFHHSAPPKLRTSAGFLWNKSQLSPSW